MSENEIRAGVGGPHVRTFNYGANREELEFSALDTGRKCFGEDARLELVPDYQIVHRSEKGDFFAAIEVRCLP